MSTPTASDFQRALDSIFRDAQEQQLAHIEVVSGDMNHDLGGQQQSAGHAVQVG